MFGGGGGGQNVVHGYLAPPDYTRSDFRRYPNIAHFKHTPFYENEKRYDLLPFPRVVFFTDKHITHQNLQLKQSIALDISRIARLAPSCPLFANGRLFVCLFSYSQVALGYTLHPPPSRCSTGAVLHSVAIQCLL